MLNVDTILFIGEKCDEMLVVGTASSIEEQKELHFIAEIAIIGERIRYIARQQKNRRNKIN